MVRANYIYTRVEDTNTDIDKSADINHIAYLWKKRFLLNRPPLEQITKRLNNKKEWNREEDTYYNIFNPEYTIEILGDEDEQLEPEFYSYSMYNKVTHYSLLEIKYYGTKLYCNQIVILDSGRYVTVTPNWEFLHFGKYKTEIDYAFKYFIKQDINYKLHIFLLNDGSHETLIAQQRLYEVILIFESSMEKEQFVNYLHSHPGQITAYINAIDKTYSWVEAKNERHRKEIVKRLKTGIALNKMLEEFRGL